MRALVRGKEVMTEPFSPWVQNNLAFLTGKEKDAEGNPLPGDGWTLVEDYHEPVEGPEEPVEGPKESEPVQSTPSAEQDTVDLTETVTYGGKEYTLEELKKLIG